MKPANPAPLLDLVGPGPDTPIKRALRLREELIHLTANAATRLVSDCGAQQWRPVEAATEEEQMQFFHDALKWAPLVLWRPDIWDSATGGSQGFVGRLPPDEAFDETPAAWIWVLSVPRLPEVPQPEFKEPPELGAELFDVAFLAAHVVFSRWRPVPHLVGYEVSIGMQRNRSGPHEKARAQARMAFRAMAGELVTDQAAPFLARALFLQQPFVGQERHEYPRQQRRLAERKHQHLPEVLTVTLRRAGSRRANPDAESQEVDWSCCWLRAPHWRRQWLPSQKKHEMRFIIEEKLRGNPDQPLRPTRPTVYDARR